MTMIESNQVIGLTKYKKLFDDIINERYKDRPDNLFQYSIVPIQGSNALLKGF